MKQPTEPSAESLEEMPEIDEQRFRRRPGRGHHADRQAGHAVIVDDDVWAHFEGSPDAINAALRRLIGADDHEE